MDNQHWTHDLAILFIGCCVLGRFVGWEEKRIDDTASIRLKEIGREFAREYAKNEGRDNDALDALAEEANVLFGNCPPVGERVH